MADGQSSWWEGAYKFFTDVIQKTYDSINHTYVNPLDTEEDDTSEQTYTTTVVCGTPLRETKCMFVPEMNDFYTDEELNTVYHSADEYRNAITKYGLIYKSQKFENADTPQKLFDYAKDWIKNNYHGGITSFNITALDMHLAGVDTDKYLVGQRVDVDYIDPILKTEAEQTLTIISAEYKLNNPEGNNYKIGIPDVTLNKVYGETTKSGGGGGGGKPADETDNETEVDGVVDQVDEAQRETSEIMLKLINKVMRNGDDAYGLGTSNTPSADDPTGNFLYNLTADGVTAGQIKGAIGQFATSVVSGYLRSTGGLDTVSVNATDANMTNISGKTATIETIEDVKKITGTAGEFSSLKVGGRDVAKASDVVEGRLQLTINSKKYTIQGHEGWN